MEFGLSEKEAKVYLALLELGMATVHKIAEASSLNRSSTYVILGSLKRKSLVSDTGDNQEGTLKYAAAAPNIFTQSLESSLFRDQIKLNQARKIIPDLMGLHNRAKQKPKIQLFEGKDGLISALEDSLNNNKEKLIRLFSSAENALAISPEYWSAYGQKRIKLKIKQRAILADNKSAHALFAMGPLLYEAIFIPKNKYPFPVDMMITDDKVGYLIIDKENVTTIVIQNRQIAEVMKALFDMTWKEAARIGKSQK